MELREVLQEALRLQDEPYDPNPVRSDNLIKKIGPKTLKPLIPEDYQARGGTGEGMAAVVTWIAILPPGASPKSGIYLVYLFAADGSVAYLSLNQGVSELQDGSKALFKRGQDIRDAIDPQPDLAMEIDLRSQRSLPKKYEAGNVYALAYDSSQLPSNDQIKTDLDRMLQLLDETVQTGLTFDGRIEPMHLVLKWNPNINGRLDTVQRHKEIADAKGSVWWAGFGDASKKGMSDSRMKRLRDDQLGKDIQTFAFLTHAGDIWRTKVLHLTTNAEDVDQSKLPDYYSVSDGNVFFELTGFEQLERGWGGTNLVLTSTKKLEHLTEPQRMNAALKNQATPMYVYEKARAKELPKTREPEEPASDRKVLDIQWLEATTLWSQSDLNEMLELLEGTSPQIVLAGPPGTGKTWVAHHLARHLTQDRKKLLRTVQLHPSYGYEDFIEGLRPTTTDGVLKFEETPGPVLQMAELARVSRETHVLLVDEMNRANLPRVFGELMYLFEYRDEKIDLRFSKGFELPKNLVFIGTMNTADRSIRSIDLALRRRFEVIECVPDPSILESYYESRPNEVEDLVSGFEDLNNELELQLDRHHQIGHTFFMTEHMTHAVIEGIWKRKIGPLIEEYFFDQTEAISDFSVEKFWPSD